MTETKKKPGRPKSKPSTISEVLGGDRWLLVNVENYGIFEIKTLAFKLNKNSHLIRVDHYSNGELNNSSLIEVKGLDIGEIKIA